MKKLLTLLFALLVPFAFACAGSQAATQPVADDGEPAEAAEEMVDGDEVMESEDLAMPEEQEVEEMAEEAAEAADEAAEEALDEALEEAAEAVETEEAEETEAEETEEVAEAEETEEAEKTDESEIADATEGDEE